MSDSVTARTVPSRFTYIDALRGLAAISVVVFHLGTSSGVRSVYELSPDWLSRVIVWGGHLGVIVFFVISGFVMAHATSSTKRSLEEIGRTFGRRLIRLAPPYWAAIIASIVISVAVSTATGNIARIPSIPQLIAHLFYLQKEFGFDHVDGVYWTLCLEVRFYLVFLAAFALSPRPQWMALFALGLAIAGLGGPAGVYGSAHLPGSGTYGPTTIAGIGYSFALGCVCYYARLSTKFLLGAVLCFWVTVGVGVTKSDPRCVAAGATGFAVLAIDRVEWLQRRVEVHWLLGLGTISYSLYLFHGPVGLTICAAGGRLLPPAAPLAAGVFLAGLASSIAAAWLAYRIVELPAIQLSRRLKPAKHLGDE